MYILCLAIKAHLCFGTGADTQNDWQFDPTNNTWCVESQSPHHFFLLLPSFHPKVLSPQSTAFAVASPLKIDLELSSSSCEQTRYGLLCLFTLFWLSHQQSIVGDATFRHHLVPGEVASPIPFQQNTKQSHQDNL